MSVFDDCFHTFPDFSKKPKDWETFYSREISALKKIPIELKSKRKVSKKLLTENSYILNYTSTNKYTLQAHLVVPKKVVKKPPLVVIFPDYHQDPSIFSSLSNAGYAQLVLRLRGHEVDLLSTIDTKEMSKEEIEQLSYGYFQASLSQKKSYYLKQLYLDAFRTLEIARLRSREVDTSKIGVWGKGVGASMALFVTYFMKRTTSLFLEHPTFINLEVSQNKSKAKYSNEINNYIKTHKREKAEIKKNLNYLDGMYFAQDLEVPTAVAVNLKSKLSIPHSSFSAFHSIIGEKEMFIHTEDKPASLKKEKKIIIEKAVDFFDRFLK